VNRVDMKTDRILVLATLLIPFAVYMTTLTPTVSFFDSGELISGAATLGISHPPGYPLYILLGHAFSYIPLGNIAFRINTASAFFGALAVTVLYLITLNVMKRLFPEEKEQLFLRMAALSSSLMFAFSLNQWGQTNMSEVYALNTFIVGLLILTALVWHDYARKRGSDAGKGNARLFYFFAFIFGLGFGDHHTILVVVPVGFFVILATRWQCLFDIKKLFLCLAFFTLGFSVYLYMPVRATTDLIMNWGNPETWKQFRWMFFREGYPKGQVYRDWSLFWEQLQTINLLYEYTIAGFAVAITGLLRFFRRGWLFALISFTVLGVLSVGLIIYSSAPRENIFLYEAFHTPTYMIFAPWIGLGLFWFLSCLKMAAKRLNDSAYTGKVLIAFWLIMLAAMPALPFYNHFKKNDRSRNFIAYDYASNSLKSLSPNGILFTWGDSGAFPLWYLNHVEKYKPGALLLHTPHLASDWYVDEIADLKNSRVRRVPARHRSPGMVVEYITRENLGLRRSYIDYSSKYSFPVSKLNFASHGVVYRNGPEGARADISVWSTYVTRGLLSNNVVRDLDIGKAIAIYGFCRFDSGAALISQGMREEGVKQLSEAIKIVPGLRGKAQNLLFPRNKPAPH